MSVIKIELSKEEIELVNRAFDTLRPGAKAGLGERVEIVLTSLLDQWDAMQEMFDGVDERPVEVPSDVEDAMRSITDPDIGLEVKVKDSEVTPRSTDGLVPWDYILEGYPKLAFVAALAKDYSDIGEKKVALIRTVLTRTPEDQWESEQTRSIIARALAAAEVLGFK